MSKKPTYNELEERVRLLEKKIRSYEEIIRDIRIEAEGSSYRFQDVSFEGMSVCEENLIIDANRALSTITGYDAQELIGMDILYLFTPACRDFVRYNMDNIFDNPYEAVCLRKDGTSLPVEIQGKNFTFLGQKQSVIYLRDIKVRKQAEELYKTMAEESQAGVYVVQNGKFIYVNDNAAGYTGYSPQELVGRDTRFCVHFDDRKIIEKNLRRALKDKRSRPYTYRIITKDGSMRWLIETVSPIYFGGEKMVLGNVMDVTEIKEARQRLEELEELEASILDAIPHAVIGFEKRHIIFANNAVEDVFGWKPEELIGRLSRILYRNDEEYEEIGAVFYNLREEQRTQTREYPCVKKDGSEITTMMSASVIGKNIKDRKVVVMYENITERKRAREKLHEYHEKLRSLASELSMTEERERQFIATALHDGISQTMAVAKIKMESLQQEAETTKLSGPLKEIIALMNQLIYDTRSLTLDLSPPVLYILGIEAALEWLAEQFQEKYALGVVLDMEKISVNLNKDISFFLFRSTQELLMNVVKHARTKEALVSLKKVGDDILLSVEDEGVGFDKSDLELPDDWSKGFGLFSIRERVDYLGGQCYIESQKGVGTRITMIVPPTRAGKKDKGHIS
ncbi:MAG TPA: PAS domain S-box protein [Syntrophales bacterium]|nr:PAS domain S-box protein [Syntrophales bacterium]HPQ43513.1 PAS domain S-box protein [Syntrophales bacterium]